ncbi:fumarylacetoacetase [Emticicia sp. BO119]|uniref:fumarylacetoacetase n=1 Tax=Emticicia sp. BO119 TaxID=2757768 RepID=UPI0015F0875E|nr:fumarylacetoacetase [Emticicia sp. BO119]MBA4849716.1 fumarylacetoacetase [Emticicia sp. BO119]
MNSWLNIPSDSDFSIYNLPFGIFSIGRKSPRMGVRIGDFVIDMEQLRKFGLIEVPRNVCNQAYLNNFINLGKKKTNAVRLQLQEWLIKEKSPLKRYFKEAFYPIESVKMHLPVKVGDYTDFYSSLEHATNVGKMFRPDNPLVANWKYIPIAYHGRASSIVVSGTPVVRPKGQIKPADSLNPVFSPTKEMDFEVEIGAIIGKNSLLGENISTEDAENYIFGLVLFNDWSARDIQRWEYQPLGPFLGKNFASSISPWVVTLEALAHFRTATPVQDPLPLPYLAFEGKRNFDIKLAVNLITKDKKAYTISNTNFRYMYWNLAQQIAHHTINGCNLKIGDIIASGTISGPIPDSSGCLLELSIGGKQPIVLENNLERAFLEDGDTLTIGGFSEKDGIRVGFGEVSGEIVASR